MADRIEDGGPAFGHGSPEVGGHPGMSLRDWFAGQALVGIVEEHSVSGLPGWQKDAAWKAYSMADAMLSARQKGGA